MLTWISPGLPPLVFSHQAIMSVRPVPPCENFRWPIFLPSSSYSETTCSCDAQSIPTNHLRSLLIMHSPLLGAICWRALIVHANNLSLAATPAYSCTGALGRNL